MVWGAVMVFFQFMLLLGHVFTHLLHRRLGVGRAGNVQAAVLVLSILLLPLSNGIASPPPPESRWIAGPLFLTLLTTLAPAVFALSCASVALQRWFAAERPTENPYKLYSASNAGSFTGLLLFPLVAEPWLEMNTALKTWQALHVAFVLFHLAALPRGVRSLPLPSPSPASGRKGRPLVWILLSAGSCAFFISVTNWITLDTASVPLLWIAPLGLYLLSFVLAFGDRPPPLGKPGNVTVWCAMLLVGLLCMQALDLTLPVWVLVPLCLGLQFALNLVCHTLLVRSRPVSADDLTTFYVSLAMGGLLGGIAVTWIAPLLFHGLVEVPGSAFAVCALVLWMEPSTRPRLSPLLRASLGFLLLLALLTFPWTLVSFPPLEPAFLFILLSTPMLMGLLALKNRPAFFLPALAFALLLTSGGFFQPDNKQTHRRLRNYYGIYHVYDQNGIRWLRHGSTLHGGQWLQGPKRETPLAYYHPTTPSGEIFSDPALTGRDIGMVGLGSGALAAYLHAPQNLWILEIDPDNPRVAREDFGFLDLAETRGVQIDIRVGDGRILLQEFEPESLDLLVLDAFSSGSIPVHLLTLEAFTEYFRVLRPGGMLLVHVSNKNLRLQPVVGAAAHRLGVVALQKENDFPLHPDAYFSEWMVLTRNPETEQKLRDRGWAPPAERLPRPWTDSRSDLIRVLRWGRND